MRRMKRMMSVLASMVLVLAMAIPVSAAAETAWEEDLSLCLPMAFPVCADEEAAEMGGMQRAPGTVACSFNGCSLTATFRHYNNGVPGYTNPTDAGHDETLQAVYRCSQGHETVKEVNIGTQSHAFKTYDSLGHTTPTSNTHQYWVKCPCGYGKNYYIDCNYNKTGVHTKPW